MRKMNPVHMLLYDIDMMLIKLRREVVLPVGWEMVLGGW